MTDRGTKKPWKNVMSQASTVQRIADEVGVTTRTVHRVLTQPLRDRRKTYVERARRIRSLARQLGYRPNTAARATRTGSFGAMALMLSPGRVNWLPGELARELAYAAQRRQLLLNLAVLPDEQMTDSSYVPRVLTELAVDGLLVDYLVNVPEPMLRLIEDHAIPAVWLNHNRSRDCLSLDDAGATGKLTRRFIEMGHRRIAYAGLLDGKHYSHAARRDGYTRVMEEAGLTPVVGSYELAERFADPAERPTAVVCFHRPIGVAMYAAARDHGLRVPKDVSIAGIGDDSAENLRLPIDLLYVPNADLAESAVDLLQEKITHSGTPRPSRVLPFGDVVDRGGSAPPNASR